MTQAEFSMGLQLPHCHAYEAYQELLRSLLLNEFPCGLGEWREDFDIIQTELSRVHRRGGRNTTDAKPNLTDHVSAVTLKDVSPHVERQEVLQHLATAKESPWRLECDWTDEGERLRQLAIEQPWTVTRTRVNGLLRTLKIHDKNVGSIDCEMRKLTGLQQLVLSANFLTWIDGCNLPQGLQVLELHGNFIDDLSGLLPDPPRLEHLGVGRNNLTYVGETLNGANWPCLLSLDLSYNHLEDLKALLESLVTLPKLRSLILAGNPLALTPWYRGFTIDTLRSLLTLDDAKISADERHFFRGMTRRREFVQDTCQMRIRVSTLQHLPVPPEVANPDEFPEFPLIVRKYFVQFWLPYEEEPAASDRRTAEATEAPSTEKEEASSLQAKGKLQKSAGFMSDIPEEPAGDEHDGGQTAGRAAPGGQELITRVVRDCVCSPLRSLQRSYAELTSGETANQVDWEGLVTKANLRQTRDFLLHAVQLDVVEETSHLYPPDQLPQEGHDGPPEKKKDEKKDEGKPKKKKKIDESSLVAYSTETTELATFNVDLSSLLNGEQKVALSLKSQAVTPPSTVPSTPAVADRKSKEKAAPKDDKRKAADKGKGSSAKPGNKKGAKEAANVDDDEEEKQPPPLEVAIEFQRIQWRNVKDCPTNVMIAVDQS